MSKTQREALGKGLGALLGSSQDEKGQWAPRHPLSEVKEIPAPEGTSEIPLNLIDANPLQPRTEFNPEALEELAQSIRELGIIQPLTLRRMETGRYQIISGERRFRAAHLAGLGSVPAYIRQIEDRNLLELSLVENIQREDLDAMEVAFGFQRLIEECDYTQEALADRVGKKRATVANYLRLLRLPAQVQLLLRGGHLSMGHARALLSLEDPSKQINLAGKIIKNDLSVRQTEKLIRQEQNRELPSFSEPTAELPETYLRVLEIVGQHFGNNISIKRNEKGAGALTIHFSSDREMEHFLTMLEKNKM